VLYINLPGDWRENNQKKIRMEAEFKKIRENTYGVNVEE